MEESPVWETLPGQLTDDTELALALADSILENEGWIREKAQASYRQWLESGPFDCGTTTWRGIHEEHDEESQTNGALMRVWPIGIVCATARREQVEGWARGDATVTHPNSVCQQVNMLYAGAIARAVGEGMTGKELYRWIVERTGEDDIDEQVREWTRERRPKRFAPQMGWVKIAYTNALDHLEKESSVEQAVVQTVAQGGDTDTNACVVGALVGAIQGEEAVPARWRESLRCCRPEHGREGVKRPRPEEYWPTRGIEVADRLIKLAERSQDG